jgi:hypothetical protein
MPHPRKSSVIPKVPQSDCGHDRPSDEPSPNCSEQRLPTSRTRNESRHNQSQIHRTLDSTVRKRLGSQKASIILDAFRFAEIRSCQTVSRPVPQLAAQEEIMCFKH